MNAFQIQITWANRPMHTRTTTKRKKKSLLRWCQIQYLFEMHAWWVDGCWDCASFYGICTIRIHVSFAQTHHTHTHINRWICISHFSQLTKSHTFIPRFGFNVSETKQKPMWIATADNKKYNDWIFISSNWWLYTIAMHGARMYKRLCNALRIWLYEYVEPKLYAKNFAHWTLCTALNANCTVNWITMGEWLDGWAQRALYATLHFICNIWK